MSRVAKTPQDITLAGLAPTMAAPPATGANNGITFPADNCWLVVFNAGAGTCTLTYDSTAYVGGIALADQTATCANDSVTRHYGPFSAAAFGGTVGVDFSLVTGVTCAVLHIPNT
jgi:hypothetical protein